MTAEGLTYEDVKFFLDLLKKANGSQLEALAMAIDREQIRRSFNATIGVHRSV